MVCYGTEYVDHAVKNINLPHHVVTALSLE
jgi:hypothetical protein